MSLLFLFRLVKGLSAGALSNAIKREKGQVEKVVEREREKHHHPPMYLFLHVSEPTHLHAPLVKRQCSHILVLDPTSSAYNLYVGNWIGDFVERRKINNI